MLSQIVIMCKERKGNCNTQGSFTMEMQSVKLGNMWSSWLLERHLRFMHQDNVVRHQYRSRLRVMIILCHLYGREIDLALA